MISSRMLRVGLGSRYGARIFVQRRASMAALTGTLSWLSDIIDLCSDNAERKRTEEPLLVSDEETALRADLS
jgi:hypothetical protein